MGFTVIVEGEIACVNRMTPMLGRGEAVSTENNAGEDAIQSQFDRMFHRADFSSSGRKVLCIT
jgi:hypothetical protein